MLSTPQMRERLGVFIAQRRQQRRWTMVALALAAVALVSIAAMLLMPHKPKTATKPQPVLTVSVTPARVAQVPATLQVSGTVSARDPLTIGAEATGLRIDQVLVEEGQYVKRGQVLATLDSSVLRAQLAAARARVSGSTAAVSKAIQPNRPQDINALRAAHQQALADVDRQRALIAQAQATLQNAQDVAQRNTAVYRQGGISYVEAEQQITNARSAQENVRSLEHQLAASQFAAQQAQQRLNMAESGGRREDIVSAQAMNAENQAQVQQLQAQINQTVVRAPDDGLITKRTAHIGDIATTAKSMFEMVRGGILELRADVTQRDLAQVHPGNPAAITDGVRTTSGVVTDITPAVDPTNRLATVRIRLAGNSGFLPGMFAHAALNVGTQRSMVVPQQAVQGQENAYSVFVYSPTDQRAHQRPVVVSGRTAQTAQIASGLNEGDLVIVNGAGFLADNDLVKLGR
jgi:HlyD family secretion protein